MRLPVTINECLWPEELATVEAYAADFQRSLRELGKAPTATYTAQNALCMALDIGLKELGIRQQVRK